MAFCKPAYSRATAEKICFKANRSGEIFGAVRRLPGRCTSTLREVAVKLQHCIMTFNAYLRCRWQTKATTHPRSTNKNYCTRARNVEGECWLHFVGQLWRMRGVLVPHRVGVRNLRRFKRGQNRLPCYSYFKPNCRNFGAEFKLFEPNCSKQILAYWA